MAEIGAEKITDADLGAIIESDIENQLSSMAAFLSDEQLREQKKKMLQQYKSADVRQKFLQGWLAQEILYRQALSEKLSEKEDVKKLLGELARRVLSQQLMNQQLADKINITEPDLETYYAANKDKYVEPAKATISHILVGEEEQAKDLIGRIKEGQDFADLAKEFSRDEGSKADGGKIDSDVTPGSHVAGIGYSRELNEKIFQAEPPALVAEPAKTEKGWEIVKVESKTAERQKGFDEVKQQVMSALLTRKRKDVQEEYIRQMMDKYNVIIHTSAQKKAETPDEK